MHPTRLSKICARQPAHLVCAGPRQASKLAPATSAPLADTYDRKTIRTLKRTKQEGRIPPRTVARTEFCYHSLQGTSFLYTTAASPRQVLRKARYSSDPQFGDSFRIPESGPPAQVLLLEKTPEFSTEMERSMQAILNKSLIDFTTGRSFPH